MEKMTSDFIWHVEDVLNLCEQPYDPKRPVICFDERRCQLISDAIIPIPIKPEGPNKKHYEYIRNGTRCIFWLLSLAQARGSSVLRNAGRRSIMQIL